MFLLQPFLKQTNKKIPNCACRLPHAHSSCLPTPESPGREEHMYGGEALKERLSRRGHHHRKRLARAAPFALAKTFFIIPGRESTELPWKNETDQLFPHGKAACFLGCVDWAPAPLAPHAPGSSAPLRFPLRLNLPLQSAAGHRERASSRSRAAPRLSASTRASKTLRVFALDYPLP